MTDLLDMYEFERVATILDRIKDFGFKFATYSGITWSYSDMQIPKEKEAIIAAALSETEVLAAQYNEGLLSDEERYRKAIEIWTHAKMAVEERMPHTLDKNGPVYDMWKSGARGQIGQITQMSGMKGLITNTVGRILEHPVISSYKEGLTPIEYFITTHGARYGLTTTALQTARAGYLTRRLVDVAQDCIILDDDCGDRTGRKVERRKTGTEIGTELSKAIMGRVLAKDVVKEDGTTLFAKGTVLRGKDVMRIEKESAGDIYVRTPFSCKSVHGMCRNCYGLDLGRYKLVEKGEAVGIIAAQAIGEPGTQLTMRTFHQGGVAGEDITMGLPRVEEIFERRPPKNPAIISKTGGIVLEVKKGKSGERTIIIAPDVEGKSKKSDTLEYAIPYGRTPAVKEGAEVAKGDFLTDGSADLNELFKFGGKERAEEYIVSEIARVYDLQGASVSRKHIEVIVRQMLSRRRIKETGNTKFSVGDIIEESHLNEENERVVGEGGEEGKGERLILGISDVALSTKSFLSSASFQNTTKVLIRAALRGATDNLRGIKENVIIGRLIPAGTGFRPGAKEEVVEEEETEEEVKA